MNSDIQKETFQSYLKLLGLPPDFTRRELCKAYRKIALKTHPDKRKIALKTHLGKGDDPNLFIMATEAYEYLMELLEERSYRDIQVHDYSEALHTDKATVVFI